ncbi:MAG: hypothetical protein BHV69_08930 [Bacteroidales bacterium 52_46]|nr:MAG: hypothetical protein BHV69_08930 [Bacteroidales bacterium 52_46]
MNKILKYFTIALLGAGAASCEDFFDLKPQNEMVLEEFWQNESDALSVVGSCYRSMQEPGFMQRLLVWGEFRSDNCILGSGDGGDLNNIANLNLLPSNGYASWSDFYAVINLCNTVEHFAPIAYERDPNFTLGQLNGYLAEVKTIRAYCYFTLVRAFRDIPFTTEPTIDDTVPMRLPQSDPDEIINFLIDDLKAAEPGAITRWSQVSYTKGRITQNAVRCLIADMCLWQGRYAEAEEYCNRILMDGNSELELVSPNNYNKGVFIDGNSTESIFELQFNRGIIPNYAVCEFYGTAGGRGPQKQMVAYDFTTTELWDDTDERQYDFYFADVAGGTFPIKKFVSYRRENDIPNQIRESDYNDVGDNAGNTNWIFYRLADVYLMKAEALTEQNKDLGEAFNLVKMVYDRANSASTDGLTGSYGNQEAMRQLVLDERQREFMFEGKRYYDLLRAIRKDPSRFQLIVSTYLTPKYVTLDQATISSKLKNMDALYMPIKDSELKANHQLKQNPFYEMSTDIDVKN